MKPKRTKSRTRSSRSRDQITHVHVVIDDQLREGLQGHARKLEGISHAKNPKRPNLSAAIRDLLRRQLGLSDAEAA